MFESILRRTLCVRASARVRPAQLVFACSLLVSCTAPDITASAPTSPSRSANQSLQSAVQLFELACLGAPLLPDSPLAWAMSGKFRAVDLSSPAFGKTDLPKIKRVWLKPQIAVGSEETFLIEFTDNSCTVLVRGLISPPDAKEFEALMAMLESRGTRARRLSDALDADSGAVPRQVVRYVNAPPGFTKPSLLWTASVSKPKGSDLGQIEYRASLVLHE